MKKALFAFITYFLFVGSAWAQIQCREIETVWQPRPEDLCGPSGMGYQRSNLATHPASYDQRNRCAPAPRVGGTALQIRTFRGLYNSLMDHNREIEGLAATHVKFTVQMFMDPNYEYF